MKIVLVRHAKAEHVYDKSDVDRNLTSEGVQRFTPNAESLVGRLSSEDELIIWDSIAKRSIETADIIVENLVGDYVRETQEAIYYGYFEELLSKMRLLNNNVVLVIVGHQPSLSQWSNYLCGESLPYKTGHMACFEVNSFDPLEADLLWLIP